MQSRYYNPSWGRFINADGYVSTGQGFTGDNMFAYCNNNPINCVDSAGAFPWKIITKFAVGFGAGIASSIAGSYLAAELVGIDIQFADIIAWAIADGILMGLSFACTPDYALAVAMLEVTSAIIKADATGGDLGDIALSMTAALASIGISEGISFAVNDTIGKIADPFISMTAQSAEAVISNGLYTATTSDVTKSTNTTYQNPATAVSPPRSVPTIKSTSKKGQSRLVSQFSNTRYRYLV